MWTLTYMEALTDSVSMLRTISSITTPVCWPWMVTHAVLKSLGHDIPRQWRLSGRPGCWVSWPFGWQAPSAHQDPPQNIWFPRGGLHPPVGLHSQPWGGNRRRTVQFVSFVFLRNDFWLLTQNLYIYILIFGPDALLYQSYLTPSL